MLKQHANELNLRKEMLDSLENELIVQKEELDSAQFFNEYGSKEL